MAYRFTTTEKWTDSWFSQLTPLQMLLFIYICDNCDIAGFINVNIKRWASDLNSTHDNILGALKGLSRGLIYSTNKEVLFVKNFLKHQKNYPLNPNNNAHLGILKRVEDQKSQFAVDSLESLLSLESLGAGEGLPSPYGKGNGKGSGKGNGKGSGKDKYTQTFKNSLMEYGADEQLVDDWLKIREDKDATNSESALKLFMNQVEKSGHDINEVLKVCIAKSWKGFNTTWKADWEQSATKKQPLPTLEEIMAEKRPEQIKRIFMIRDTEYGGQRPVNMNAIKSAGGTYELLWEVFDAD